jgi:hypothetical protein
MSTPFLEGFAHALVDALERDGLLEVRPGRSGAVAAHLAATLGASDQPRSLVSLTARALLDCPDVDELYADDEALKRTMEDLGR